MSFVTCDSCDLGLGMFVAGGRCGFSTLKSAFQDTHNIFPYNMVAESCVCKDMGQMMFILVRAISARLDLDQLRSRSMSLAISPPLHAPAKAPCLLLQK